MWCHISFRLCCYLNTENWTYPLVPSDRFLVPLSWQSSGLNVHPSRLVAPSSTFPEWEKRSWHPLNLRIYSFRTPQILPLMFSPLSKKNKKLFRKYDIILKNRQLHHKTRKSFVHERGKNAIFPKSGNLKVDFRLCLLYAVRYRKKKAFFRPPKNSISHDTSWIIRETK